LLLFNEDKINKAFFKASGLKFSILEQFLCLICGLQCASLASH